MTPLWDHGGLYPDPWVVWRGVDRGSLVLTGSGRVSERKISGPPDGEITGEISRALPPELEAREWKPGQSGNPAGRPRRAPEFREKCRALSEKALDQLEKRIDAGDLNNADLVRAMETLAAHGGFLRGEALATVDVARWRVLLELLGSKQLDKAQRATLLRAIAGTLGRRLGSSSSVNMVAGDSARTRHDGHRRVKATEPW